MIDLQNGIASLPAQPSSAEEVIDASRNMAEACRKRGASEIYVRVNLADMLLLETDLSLGRQCDEPVPASASELVVRAGLKEGDLIVMKRHWGAFDTASGLESVESARYRDNHSCGDRHEFQR